MIKHFQIGSRCVQQGDEPVGPDLISVPHKQRLGHVVLSVAIRTQTASTAQGRKSEQPFQKPNLFLFGSQGILLVTLCQERGVNLGIGEGKGRTPGATY